MILVVATFAFAYFISSAVESVSAASPNEVCCERTNDEWCVDTSQNNCDKNYRVAPTSCNQTSFCKSGCCYNSDNGLCSGNSQEAACVSGGGQWTKNDIYCGISQCRESCCVYSDQATWTTQKHCEDIGATGGIESEWRQDILNELQCILLTETQEQGACVFEQDFESNCKFTTKAECIRLTGSASSFYKNKLCSSTELNTICEKQTRTGCIAGRDEVFWFDSCGNRENIYSSDKTASWNNGNVLSKNQSCGADSKNGNANSKTCGNCDYIKGSICGQSGGDYICKDLSCKNVVIGGKTVTKQHGESWCSFDGAIGVGEVTGNNKIARDVVGSRHWRHICINGEERIEPCEDYRNQVCTEQKEETTERTYSACRLNEWQECIDMNTREMDAEECEKKTDCWVKEISVDDFKFKMCVPKYPEGFDIQDANSQEDAQGICSMGTQTCTVIYIKKSIFSSCKPSVNKNCLKPGFTQQMNSLCTSLGDCGGYVNIAGEYSDGGYLVKDGGKKRKDLPQSDIQKYISFANPLLFLGQRVDPGNLTLIPTYLGALGANIQSPDSGLGFINQLAQYGGYAAVAFLANTAAYAIYYLIKSIAFGLSNPIGWLIFAVLAFFYILFGEKVCKKVQVTYNCMPWQPPYGGDNCKLCNEGMPCTKYRCQSLGAACEFINEGTDNELCIASENDGTSPRINPLLGKISEGYQYVNSNPQGFDYGFEIKPIETAEDNCIPAFTPIEFGIKTMKSNGEPKASQCKIDLQHTETFEEMADYFGGNNLFLYNHTTVMSLPSPESLADYFEVPTANILEKYGNLNMYVRCKDTHGNENTAEYSIKMCVKEGPDTTPPYIISTLPENNGYLAFGKTSKNIKLWVNEPAECKYSTSDKSFEQMENPMSCAIHLEDYDLRGGWPCEFNVSDISQDKTLFIRCKDKPWLINDTEEEKRFAMQQSYEYTLKISKSELKIDSISPEERKEIFVGVEPATIELEVLTSGGAEEGKAVCEWEEIDKGWGDLFLETDSATHKTSLPLLKGDYNFKIICEDKAGNKAEASTKFKIKVDTSAPKVTRVYNSGGSLKVVTNEDAVCAYSFDSCKFGFDDPDVELMSGSEKEHTESWQTEQTYYIKCKDYYENSPSRCSIIVRPYDLV